MGHPFLWSTKIAKSKSGSLGSGEKRFAKDDNSVVSEKLGSEYELHALLPGKCGLSDEVLVWAWRMSEQISQRLEIVGLRYEATFQISLKHHADVER